MARIRLTAGLQRLGLALALPFLSLAVSTGTVRADPDHPRASVILHGIASKLEAENAQCSVELTYTGSLNTRQMETPSTFDSALVVIYTVEGCGGGINWSATAQVYGLRDETFREVGEPQTWLNVQGVEFSYTRALIRALNLVC